jgi:hypothetical protein
MIHDQRERQTQPAINDCQIATNPFPLMRHLLAWLTLRQTPNHKRKNQQAFDVYFASTYTD